VLALAFNGQSLASGSADGLLILWNLTSTSPLAQPLTGHRDVVTGLAFSPDGRLLASGSWDFEVRLWDIPTRRALEPPLTGHLSLVSAVAFSPDGRLLASASDDKTARLWEVETRQPLGPPLTGHHSPLVGVIFSPEDQTLVSTDEDRMNVIWDLETSQPLKPSLPIQGKPVTFSPDDRLLAAGGEEITLWDMAHSRPLSPTLAGYAGAANALAFSPDGRILVSGGNDTSLILWDVASHRPIHQPLTGHTNWVRTVAFSPDGQTLASGSEDGTVRLWDMTTRQPLGLPLFNGDLIWKVAFSPDGKLLASAGRNDGTILLWDLDPVFWQARVCRMVGRNLTLAEWQQFLGDVPYRLTCAEAPPPARAEFAFPTPVTTPPSSFIIPAGMAKAAPVVETFDSGQGFIQTSSNVYIDKGRVIWHFKRDGGKQYVYRPIPPFRSDVRLIVQGQINSWTNNCGVYAGIGDAPGSGVSIDFGWQGGGCPTRGPRIAGQGVTLDNTEKGSCNFVGNWLWVEAQTPYTAELTIQKEAAVLSVAGVGQSSGKVDYTGLYTTLWVGNDGRGDWPECTGTIDTVIVEPLE
jgi:hypothetical protein